MELEQILHLSTLAKAQGGGGALFRTEFRQIILHKDKVFLALIGPRGVGKTMLLKQVHSQSNDSIYISLDTLEPDTDLFLLVQKLNQEFKFKKFLLDEVHYLEDINRFLKMIFDSLEVEIVFSSSVALKLVESAHDLSRRVKVIPTLPFTFREFLKFQSVPVPPAISWEDLLESNFTAEHIAHAPLFNKYLMGHNYAFSLEVDDIMPALRANLEKVIGYDIPRLRSLNIDELNKIKKVFQFIARAPVSDVSPSSISNNLKITRYKACQYLELLEQAFIVRQVQPRGTNVMREPKILLTLPYRLLELPYKNAIGGLREDFATSCFISAGMDFSYLKSIRGEKTPDFIVGKGTTEVVIEIGGSGKTFRQFKGMPEKLKKVIFSDQLEASNSKIPLFLLGYLESCPVPRR